jgi:hypothetical protein
MCAMRSGSATRTLRMKYTPSAQKAKKPSSPVPNWPSRPTYEPDSTTNAQSGRLSSGVPAIRRCSDSADANPLNPTATTGILDTVAAIGASPESGSICTCPRHFRRSGRTFAVVCSTWDHCAVRSDLTRREHPLQELTHECLAFAALGRVWQERRSANVCHENLADSGQACS